MRFTSILILILLCFGCQNEPYEGEILTEENLLCSQASSNLELAYSDFLVATNQNYTVLCNAYSQALQNQINLCGDDGSLQTIVENLNNCQTAECDLAIENTEAAALAFSSATVDNYSQLCADYTNALMQQQNNCGDPNNILQGILNALGNCIMQEESVLCDGDANASESNTWLPLSIGNQWVYTPIVSPPDLSFVIDINNTIVLQNQTYFVLESTGIGAIENLYLRVAQNGDIYEIKNPPLESEKLYVPDAVILGSQWPYYGECETSNCSYFRRVVSINFTIQTLNCTYDDCIVVRDFVVDANGNASTNKFLVYKRGIGIVGGFPIVNLTAINLN